MRRWIAVLVVSATWVGGDGGRAGAQPTIPGAVENVIAQLSRLAGDLQLRDRLSAYRDRADIMAASYDAALRKLNISFGVWNEELKNETVLEVYLRCAGISYGALPADRGSYPTRFGELRRYLYSGAFDQMVARAAVRPRLLSLRYADFVTRKPAILADMISEANEVFDIGLLGQIEALRNRFQ